jgi:tetratricopeptide (TPR) repeat protein
MKPPSNQVDKYGFPIPPKFEEHLPPPSVTDRAGKTRAVRWVLVLLLVGVVATALSRSEVTDKLKQWAAEFLLTSAQEKYYSNNLEGALADVDRAISFVGGDEGEPSGGETLNYALYYARAHYRLESGNLEGSLADCDRLVKMQPKSPRSYTTRSLPLERMGRHREAVEALSKAIELSGPNPELLNNRAYFRALGGIELKEALEDVDAALKSTDDWTRSTYLDTRGYIYFQLGEQEKALADLDEAIEIGEELKRRYLLQQGRAQHAVQLKFQLRKQNENLAVMYHHRGEVHGKLGHAELAKVDLARGDKLGYNPAAGIH